MEAFPITIRPKSGPKTRFPAGKSYCVTVHPTRLGSNGGRLTWQRCELSKTQLQPQRGKRKPHDIALELVYRTESRCKSSGAQPGPFPRPPPRAGFGPGSGPKSTISGLSPPKQKPKNPKYSFDCIGPCSATACGTCNILAQRQGNGKRQLRIQSRRHRLQTSQKDKNKL